MERNRNGRATPTRNGAAQPEGRAKQRAFTIGALETGDDLSELHELLRTAGVAVVGQAVQHREKPHPNTYLGPGKIAEVKAAAKAADANMVATDDELTPRQERNLEKELELAGRRPHRRDPRHLRRPREHGRRQAAGRARAARVQHGPHAGSVDPPRAAQRRRGRDADAWTGRDADRDRSPSGAQPHHRAAPQARGGQGRAGDDARRARAGQRAADRAGRLHERGQVHAAQRAHRREQRQRPRPALPHAGPDDASRASCTTGRTC